MDPRKIWEDLKGERRAFRPGKRAQDAATLGQRALLTLRPSINQVLGREI